MQLIVFYFTLPVQHILIPVTAWAQQRAHPAKLHMADLTFILHRYIQRQQDDFTLHLSTLALSRGVKSVANYNLKRCAPPNALLSICCMMVLMRPNTRPRQSGCLQNNKRVSHKEAMQHSIKWQRGMSVTKNTAWVTSRCARRTCGVFRLVYCVKSCCH
jgi:hypothetical protein